MDVAEDTAPSRSPGSRTVGFGSRKTVANLVIVGVALLVVAVIWIVSVTMRSDHPTTATGVQDEVTSVLDDMQASVPAAARFDVIEDVDATTCPEGGGTMYAYERRIATDPSFDRFAWMTQLSNRYSAEDGWNVTLKPLSSRESIKLKLVNRALMVWEVTSGESPQLILHATTRCATE